MVIEIPKKHHIKNRSRSIQLLYFHKWIIRISLLLKFNTVYFKKQYYFWKYGVFQLVRRHFNWDNNNYQWWSFNLCFSSKNNQCHSLYFKNNIVEMFSSISTDGMHSGGPICDYSFIHVAWYISNGVLNVLFKVRNCLGLFL